MLDALKWLHIVFGGVALLAMAVPWLVRKGGRLHRRSGWVYVVAMAVVAGTALLMSGLRLLDGAAGNDPQATFLAYVAVLSAAGTSMGVRAVRSKHRTGPRRHPWDVGLALALVLGGVAMAAWGVAARVPLFGAFAVLGTLIGAGQLRFWLRPPRSKAAWLFEHLSSMGGACIGTFTAFAVVNARHIGVAPGSLVVWLGPSLVGGIAIALWTARYRRKMQSGVVSTTDRSVTFG